MLSAALFLIAFHPLNAAEIIGHRGASAEAPENSLSSMKLAWEQQADGIETDIHLSKDGHIVVMHDYDTKRMGGSEKKILDSTWEELQSVDIGKVKGEKWAGEKIPTLESFFATIPDGKSIFTEIKVHAEVLPALEVAMKASGKTPQQLRIITFYLDTAEASKARFPKHPVYWLVSYAKNKQTEKYPELDDLIAKAKAAQLDGLNLDYKFPIDEAFVKKVHAAGLKLYTWTVDDPEVARAEVKAGVDGITTNRPKFLREQLKLEVR